MTQQNVFQKPTGIDDIGDIGSICWLRHASDRRCCGANDARRASKGLGDVIVMS